MEVWRESRESQIVYLFCLCKMDASKFLVDQLNNFIVSRGVAVELGEKLKSELKVSFTVPFALCVCRKFIHKSYTQHMVP